MTDTPRKKLSLSRKPKPTTGASAAASDDGTGTDRTEPVKRSGKRRIVNTATKPASKPKQAANYDKSKKRPSRKNKKKALVSPSDIKVEALNQRLKSFDTWSTFKPLAMGIDKQLFQLVNDEAFAGASKKVVQKLLRMHTHNPRYLQGLSRGGVRYYLDGKSAEPISDHQKQLALDTQSKRAGRAITK